MLKTYHAIIGEKIHKNIRLSDFTHKLSEVYGDKTTVVKIMNQSALIEVKSTEDVPTYDSIKGDSGDIYLIKDFSETGFNMVLGKGALLNAISKYNKEKLLGCEYVNYTKDVKELNEVTTETQFERITVVAELLNKINEEGLTIDGKVPSSIEAKETNSFEEYFENKDKQEELQHREREIQTESNESVSSLEEEGEQLAVEEEISLTEDEDSSEELQIHDGSEEGELLVEENPLYALERRILQEEEPKHI